MAGADFKRDDREDSGGGRVSMFYASGWYDRIVRSLVALACFVGAGIAYSNGLQPGRDLPLESALMRTEGKLAWLRCKRGIVEFTLDSSPGHFVYGSKAGSIEAVCESMKNVGEARLTVLHAHDRHRSEEKVYALDTSGKQIRAYAEVAQAWRANDEQGFIAGFLLAVMGLYFLYRALIAGKNSA
jgi:hypothetical protein